MSAGLVAAILCLITCTIVPAAATDLQWHNPLGQCRGQCAVHGSFGRFSATPMTNSFGLNEEFIPDAGEYVASWNYDYEDSFLVSGTASRRVLTMGTWASAELEVGIGQRFGDMHATEVWGALYIRWNAFPWNNLVYTTAAISTGLNYATRIDARERDRDDSGSGGSQLLHYLSPEITFALPEQKDWELVFRYHHRSGGGAVFGDSALFGGVTGGANFGAIANFW